MTVTLADLYNDEAPYDKVIAARREWHSSIHGDMPAGQSCPVCQHPRGDHDGHGCALCILLGYKGGYACAVPVYSRRVCTGEDGRLNLSPLQIDALHRLIDHGWVTHVHMSTGRPHILQAGERVLKGELVW